MSKNYSSNLFIKTANFITRNGLKKVQSLDNRVNREDEIVKKSQDFPKDKVINMNLKKEGELDIQIPEELTEQKQTGKPILFKVAATTFFVLSAIAAGTYFYTENQKQNTQLKQAQTQIQSVIQTTQKTNEIIQKQVEEAKKQPDINWCPDFEMVDSCFVPTKEELAIPSVKARFNELYSYNQELKYSLDKYIELRDTDVKDSVYQEVNDFQAYIKMSPSVTVKEAVDVMDKFKKTLSSYISGKQKQIEQSTQATSGVSPAPTYNTNQTPIKVNPQTKRVQQDILRYARPTLPPSVKRGNPTQDAQDLSNAIANLPSGQMPPIVPTPTVRVMPQIQPQVQPQISQMTGQPYQNKLNVIRRNHSADDKQEIKKPLAKNILPSEEMEDEKPKKQGFFKRMFKGRSEAEE
jgi:hypothetical protein